jgi:hypothetical protein
MATLALHWSPTWLGSFSGFLTFTTAMRRPVQLSA